MQRIGVACAVRRDLLNEICRKQCSHVKHFGPLESCIFERMSADAQPNQDSVDVFLISAFTKRVLLRSGIAIFVQHDPKVSVPNVLRVSLRVGL